MPEGIMKNLENVLEGWRDFKAECKEQTIKTKEALRAKEYFRALHHATGYLEAGLQNLSKLWFYTWVPKWSLVAYMIYVGV
jgi:hypothetical protein